MGGGGELRPLSSCEGYFGGEMITLTKLNGDQFVLNSSHIEKIESIPETKVVLLGGAYYLVKDTPEEIIKKEICFQAKILQYSRIHADEDGQ